MPGRAENWSPRNGRREVGYLDFVADMKSGPADRRRAAVPGAVAGPAQSRVRRLGGSDSMALDLTLQALHNTERIHSSPGYLTPSEFERRWRGESV